MYQKKIIGEKNIVYLIRGLLIIILLIIIFGFLKLAIPFIFRQNIDGTTYGHDLPIKNLEKITVIVNLTDVDNENVLVNLSAILLPKTPQQSSNPLCIKRIVIYSPLLLPIPDLFNGNNLWDFGSLGETDLDPSFQQPSYIIPNESQRPVLPQQILPLGDGFVFSDGICSTKSQYAVGYNELKSRLIKPSELSIVPYIKNIKTAVPEFYYPFDQREINLLIWVETQEGFIVPDIIGKVYSSSWQINPVVGSTTELNGLASISFEYLRPLSVRYFVSLLLFVILLAIITSVFIKDVSSYFGVLLGMILSVDGVKSILVPEQVSGDTMINSILLSYYVLIGFTLVFRFVFIPLWNTTNSKQPKIAKPKHRNKKKNLNI